LIEFFPEGKQQLVRSVLAGVLRGIVSQRLLPALPTGRVAAVEVLVANARIADLIREDRADEIPEAIAEGDFFQMQNFTQALIELVLAGRVDREIAANSASNRHDFLVALERAVKADAVRASAVAGDDVDRPAPLRESVAPSAAPTPGLRFSPASGQAASTQRRPSTSRARRGTRA